MTNVVTYGGKFLNVFEKGTKLATVAYGLRKFVRFLGPAIDSIDIIMTTKDKTDYVKDS